MYLSIFLLVVVLVLGLSYFKVTNKLKEMSHFYNHIKVLIDNLPDTVWTSNLSGETVYISPNIASVYGYTAEEVYKEGKKLWLDRIHPEDIDNVMNSFGALFSEKIKFDIIYRIKHKDGHWIHLHDRAVHIYERDGVFFADGVFTDITEIVNMREKMISSAKVSTRGQMAANLAHELNNPLTILLGNVKKLTKSIQSDSISHEELNDSSSKIFNSASRLASIIKTIDVFTHIERETPVSDERVIDLFFEIENIIGDKFKAHGVKFATILEDKNLHLACNSLQAKQAIVNILNNALEEVVHLKGPWVKLTALLKDKDVIISIIDSGNGVNEDIREKIMQPFFSTHDGGEGTGLGLTISNKIMLAQNGKLLLDVESKNTKFDLYFNHVVNN
jgi:PAS domain S-box-containing protein